MPQDRFFHLRRWLYMVDLPPDNYGGGVYVLYRCGFVVYVGHAKKLRTRLLRHRRYFVFDAIKIALIGDRRSRQRLERKLLFKLRPSQNSIIPTVFRPAGYYMVSVSAR